jgi:predicted RNA-binding Zn ribbon-like protein
VADGHDYLLGYDQLAVWAQFAGLLAGEHVDALRARAGAQPRGAARALADARGVRTRIDAALRNPGDDRALAALRGPMRRATAALVLRDGGFEIDPHAGLRAPALAALWATGQLLASAERAMIRACAGPDCGWLFLDRGGRRRWCTMATCGNREKARRFARGAGDAS